MIDFPNAKINIGLQILSKRSDGFHELASCFYPINLKDGLEIIESNLFKFSSSGLAISGNSDSNLVVKAYNLLKKDFQLPNVHIHLHKTIPMGAGLGGGSADAAFCLKMLNKKFDLKLPSSTLENYASFLGSDCAFFIQNKVSIGKGRGNELSAFHLDLSKYKILLAYPAIHVSTAEAYSGLILESKPRQTIENILQKDISEWKNLLENDFEKHIFKNNPAIKTIKNQLYDLGAIYASMSGSGSAVYGIFSQEIGFEEAKAKLGYEAVYWV